MKRVGVGLWMLLLVPSYVMMGSLGALAATGDVTEYALLPGTFPEGLTAGPDGNLWVIERAVNKVAKVTMSGSVTEFGIPTPRSDPYGITAGQDGNLWFTEFTGNKVAKITTSGVITEYPVPISYPASYPWNIIPGPDGNLWFTEPNGGKIGRITTAGEVTEFAILASGRRNGPTGLAVGSDGNLWFTGLGNGKLGKLTTSGVLTEYAGFSGVPGLIAAGSDGNLWVTEPCVFVGCKEWIARVATNGVVVEYPVPSANSGVSDIVAGSDGNMWFTKHAANKVARITTAGVITEYPLLTARSTPSHIAAGPDGNVWVSQSQVGRVAKVVVEAPSSSAVGSPVPAFGAAKVTLSVGSGPVSTQLAVSGTGFPANAEVTLFIDRLDFDYGSPASSKGVPLQTDARGSFGGQMVIPAFTPLGSRSICANVGHSGTPAPYMVIACSDFVVGAKMVPTAASGSLRDSALLLPGLVGIIVLIVLAVGARWWRGRRAKGVDGRVNLPSR